MDYCEFIRRIEPVVMGLDSSTSSLDRVAYWSQSKDAKRVLSSRYTLAQVADNYFDIEASFSVAVQWAEGDGPVIQPLKIECVFTGHFHTAGPLEQEHAQKFTDTEAWLMFWPYFRQFVSDTTARMAIPPVIVPLALGPGEYSYSRKPLAPGQASHHAPKGTLKRRRAQKK